MKSKSYLWLQVLVAVTAIVWSLLRISIRNKVARVTNLANPSLESSTLTLEEEDELEWHELNDVRRKQLESQGWTEKRWECSGTEEEFLIWNELSEERRRILSIRLWTEELWNKRRVDPCVPKLTQSTSEDFNPIVIPISIPEVQALDMDYLQRYEQDMRLVDGYSDEKGKTDNEEFTDTMKIKDFVAQVKSGETTKYIHLEDKMYEKKVLFEELGDKILKRLRDAVSKSSLCKTGHWKPEWDTLDEDSFDWAMFLGAKGTYTHMHLDTDTFQFLYLVEGEKRVILVPNDERTAGKYRIRFPKGSGTFWPDQNILNTTKLPEHAVELELKRGEGLVIPFLAWHAVENLEATLAYSLRIGA